MVYKYTYIIIGMNIEQDCVNMCTYAYVHMLHMYICTCTCVYIHTFSASVQERALDQWLITKNTPSTTGPLKETMIPWKNDWLSGVGKKQYKVKNL